MKHNEITRELLSMRKDFFVNLHERYNFDFNGDVGFFRIDGKFTLNAVKKLVLAHGYNEFACCLVLTAISRDIEKSGLFAYSPVLVDLYHNTFETAHVTGCSTYFRKSDFNDIRKWDSISSVVIVQNKENLKSRADEKRRADKRKSAEQRRSEYNAYHLERFRVFRVERDSEEGWISYVVANDEKGRKLDIYCDFGFYDNHIYNLSKIIDGSGYIVSYHHEDLVRRLNAYKAMKANSAYAQTDNSDKVTMVNALLEARKTIIEAQFKSVKTSDDMEKFMEKMYDFKNTLRDAEFFCKRTAEKTYASIEQSERDYQYIVKKLTA